MGDLRLGASPGAEVRVGAGRVLDKSESHGVGQPLHGFVGEVPARRTGEIPIWDDAHPTRWRIRSAAAVPDADAAHDDSLGNTV
jgi:hypothetical protein